MSDYYECTPVGVDFLEQTKNVFVAIELVKATPEQVFDVFEDAHAWTEWALPIQKVEWTTQLIQEWLHPVHVDRCVVDLCGVKC